MPRPLLHLLVDHCTSLQPPSLPSSTSANPSRTEQQEGHTLSRQCPACDIAVAKQFTAFPGSGSGRLSQPCVHPHRLPGVLQCGTAFPSLPSALMLLPHCPPNPQWIIHSFGFRSELFLSGKCFWTALQSREPSPPLCFTSRPPAPPVKG